MRDYGSYYLFNENPKNRKIILTCEHAGKLFPDGYGTLGLSMEDAISTITHDIGAAEVAISLAKKLDCRLFLGKYSRVFIDLNRSISHPQLIKLCSHKVFIKDNINIGDGEFLKRINEYYWPYRMAVDSAVNENPDTFILSVHSFTPKPCFMTEIRPWHVCVGFSEYNTFAEYILSRLFLDKNIVVGVNKPFNLMKKSENGNGIAYKYGKEKKNAVLFEIRNDFILSDENQKKWADILYSLIPSLIR